MVFSLLNDHLMKKILVRISFLMEVEWKNPDKSFPDKMSMIEV